MGLIMNAAANLGRQAQALGSAISSGASDIVESLANKSIKKQHEAEAQVKQKESEAVKAAEREQTLQDKERLINTKAQAQFKVAQKTEAAKRATLRAEDKIAAGELARKTEAKQQTLMQRVQDKYRAGLEKQRQQVLKQAQAYGYQEPIDYEQTPEGQVQKFNDATQVQQAQNQLQANLGMAGIDKAQTTQDEAMAKNDAILKQAQEAVQKRQRQSLFSLKSRIASNNSGGTNEFGDWNASDMKKMTRDQIITRLVNGDTDATGGQKYDTPTSEAIRTKANLALTVDNNEPLSSLLLEQADYYEAREKKVAKQREKVREMAKKLGFDLDEETENMIRQDGTKSYVTEIAEEEV